jgi:glycolate oxidase FAD binding subunit
LPLLRPGSAAELGDIVRRAAQDNQALYPVGGRTLLGLGNPPTRQGVAVDLRGLDRVIDFPARDMTVTVEAGITIARLQALLAPENLRLPIDVPHAATATLGGVLATNVSGPRRLGYGTLRDYVIGINAVNDEGNEFHAGGRVVKNVAGYDLCKLLVGSLGTLGIITQATLKLRPFPEETALVTTGCDKDTHHKLLEQVHGSRTRPVCVELLNEPAARAVFGQAQVPPPEAPWTIIVGYEGNADAVNWQVQQLVKELGAGRSLAARVGASAQTLWRALVAWHEAPSQLTLKTSVAARTVATEAAAHEFVLPGAQVLAHAGSGIIWLRARDGLTIERAAELLPQWRYNALDGGGSAIITACPSGWKRTLDVWGPSPPDAWLMRKVKQRFDPRNLFNPGRFVDGI